MIFAVTAAKINGKTRLKTAICSALGNGSLMQVIIKRFRVQLVHLSFLRQKK